jgi:hypothetical protein
MKNHPGFIIRLCLLAMFLFSSRAAEAQNNLEAWVRRYNAGEPSSRDYGFKIAVDPQGNVIVAGDTDDGITGADFLIIKYSGAGIPLWTNRYNGTASGDDRAYALGVDQAGNVFVAGPSADAIGGVNYATLGYSSAGVPLWTNRYDGPANGEDVARALAVDHNGNVFVTGYSSSNGFYRAYLTIAYSGAGAPLWTNRSDGFYGEANALTVDRGGNVFVTGSSASDYATIAYSGAGIPLWTNRYNGGAQESASAIGVDSAGNLFVTGSSYTVGAVGPSYCATIAYSAAGIALWTNHFSRLREGHAPDLAVDHNGNVFVTGYSGSSPSEVTIAYSGAGVALWTNLCNGSSPWDRLNAIGVDHSGNVFVTFGGYLIVAYANTGEALWTNRFGPGEAYALAVGDSGNVFLTGFDYATIAYSGSGTALWTNRYDRPLNTDDKATAVAVDQSTGNVLVTGSSSSSSFGFNPDYVTIAYSEAGVALWTNRYSGPANWNRANGVAVDTAGNVIVTGTSSGEGSASDYATIAYSRSGIPLWTNRYNGTGDYEDWARAVAVDGNGNVFVTGVSNGGDSDSDYATIAYSSAGVPLWTNRYNGPGREFDDPHALAVDNAGNVFVTGYSHGGDSSADYATVAYSRTGVPLWTNRYHGPGFSYDSASAIAVDHQGRVFVTGYSSASAGSSGYVTVAYSRTGDALWTNHFNGEGGANAVAVDQNGNVIVTGSSSGMGGLDYATIAYSGAGVALWTNRYNGTANNNDYASAVIVDHSGNVFVTGYSVGPGSDYDYATVAYSGSGVPLWTNRYGGPANGVDQPALSSCLAIGRNGEVYVTGSSDGHYGGQTVSDYVTIKYMWRPYLVIQPITADSSTVNLTLSGPANSSWNMQRALTATGPWTNLGSSLIETNGLGIFSDSNPPARGAFYRVTQP